MVLYAAAGFSFGLLVGRVILAHLADEPDDGDTTADAIRLGAFARRQGREAPRPIDDEREPFLRVVERGELLHELREFVCERHAGRMRARRAGARLART